MSEPKEANLLEQHFEKGILLVAVLVLAYVAVNWLLQSPREIEVVRIQGGRPRDQLVKPPEVDAALLDAVEQVREMDREAEADAITVPDFTEVFREQMASPFPSGLRTASVSYPNPFVEGDPNGPEPPDTDVDWPTIRNAIPKPRKPEIHAARELPRLQPAADRVVAHALGAFDYAGLQRSWRNVLKATEIPPRIVVMDVEVQRQRLQPDGSWKTQDVAAVRRPLMAGRGDKPLPLPKVPPYTGDNAKAVRDAIQELDKSRWQQYLIQPEFYEIWSAGSWVTWRNALPRGLILPPGEPIPNLEQQIATGNLLVWFHDEMLESSQMYRYRYRIELLNPLYTWTKQVTDPNHADIKSGFSAWSDWSDAFSVQRATEFFVTGQSIGLDRRTARVEVFTMTLGQWVKERFSVELGRPIGAVRRVDVTNPLTGQTTESRVDFSTGAIPIAADFTKEVRRGTITRKTVELLYLTEDNRLLRMINVKDLDRDHPLYQKYQRLNSLAN